jgi:hypothetical protein
MSHSAKPAAAVRLDPCQTTFATLLWRVTACHVVTYFLAGILAYFLLDYKTFFEAGPLAALMRPIASKWVAAGPALQVLRGLIFALALYPFRRVFLEESRGWLKLWGLLLGLAILSTAGPAPGSVEGLIYTKLSLLDHLRGLPEVVGQTLAFSVILARWYHAPRRAWTIGMGVAVGLVLLMSLAGAVAARPEGFR